MTVSDRVRAALEVRPPIAVDREAADVEVAGPAGALAALRLLAH